MPAAGLFEGGFKISAGGQRYDLEAIGIGFSHAQRAAADRAGGAEDGDAFHDHSQGAGTCFTSTAQWRAGQSNLVALPFLESALRAPPRLNRSQRLGSFPF